MSRWTALLVLILTLNACNLNAASRTLTPTPQLPTAEFLFPANQSTVVEGTDLTIDIVARDGLSGIARVELRVDGSTINEASPKEGVAVEVFRVNMNWLAQGVGLHSLSSIAYRVDGTASNEAIILVEVLARE